MQLIIGLIFILLLQGCNNSESPQLKSGLVHDAVSITRTDTNAIISKDAINAISLKVADLLKSNISSFNQKEAISLTSETNYCDTSGVKYSSISSKSQTINMTTEYTNCNETEKVHNGKVNLNYIGINEDSKYPKEFNMKIEETYSFNQLELFEDVTVEGDVSYHEDGQIQKLSFKINGNVSHENENYHLQNITRSVNY